MTGIDEHIVKQITQQHTHLILRNVEDGGGEYLALCYQPMSTKPKHHIVHPYCVNALIICVSNKYSIYYISLRILVSYVDLPEYSIVADSTMSLSSPEPSPVVKRAAKTYGRRREPETLPASSSYSDATSVGSPCSIYQTGPAGLDEEIPPTSDAPYTHSEPEEVEDEANDSDADDTGNSAGFEFAWRKQLRDIDEADDDDPLVVHNVAGPQAALDASDSLSPTRAKDAAAPLESKSANNNLAPPLSVDNKHSPRASSLQPSSNNLTTTRTSTASPRRRPAIPNSDSATSPFTKSSPHLATSPPAPHPINTPGSGPSSTPPTSDDEMPTDPFAKGKLRKRSTTRRRLSFAPQPLGDDVPPSPTRASGQEKQTDSPARKRPTKKGKSRAPTKKELEETTRARARLAVDQHVSLPRTEVPQKYSITQFFGMLNRPSEALVAPNQLSDPIGQFSSPPKMPTVGRPTSPPPDLAEIPLPPNGDDADEELPAEVLYARQRQAQRNVDLREVKRKALAAQQLRPQEDSDDDLLVVDNATAARDMHMVAQEAAKERRSLKKRHMGPSQGKRIIERFGYAPSRKGEKLQTQVNAKLFESVEAQRRAEVERKQAEWKKRGGTLKSETDPIVAVKGGEDVLKVYAEKVLNAAQEEADDEDVADGSDQEWVPDEAQLRGSASPEPAEVEDVLPNDGSGSGEDEDTTMVDPENELPPASSQEAAEDASAGPSFRRSRAVKVIDSDDEDENVSPHSQFRRVQGSAAPDSPCSVASSAGSPQVIVHRASLSSFDGDENDKENNTRLMFDRSDDKENHAVVRHGLDARPALGSRQSSLRNVGDEVVRGVSLSPGQRSDRQDDERDEGGSKTRKPLKEIDADPFMSPSTSTSTSFTARLLNASPRETTQRQPSLSPFLAKRFSPLNFDPSQAPDENEAMDMDGFKVPALQTSFSQLYASQTQARGPLARSGGLDKLRKPEALDELPLTLDVTLQPALDVSEHVRKRADAVFEKEQEYLIDALQPKQSTQPQLFINDHGFLTQTRPDVESPEVYRTFSPSQRTPLLRNRTQPNFSQDSSLTQATLTSQSRHPLRTLSMMGDPDPDTPDISPLRRLRHHRSSSPTPLKDTGYDSSPAQSPVKKAQLRNAFDVLKRNAARRGGARAERDADVGREFVEAEAEESDDDMGHWGPRKRDDEAEEAEGLEADTTLVEMMDDKDMDAEVVAADRVLEKFQEHVLEDDEKLQKLHQDAVDGKLRNKRRNRIDLDGSDDESDEDADAIRRRLHKRPKTERNDIQALGRSEETKAFFDTYQDDLVDDDQALWVGVSQEDPPRSGGAPEESDRSEDEDDGGREDGGREERSRQGVSVHEIRRQVLERLDGGEIETINVNDVSWIDGRDEDEEGEEDEMSSRVRVKDVNVNGRAKSAAAAFKKKAWMDIDLDLDAETVQARGSASSSTLRGSRSFQTQTSASASVSLNDREGGGGGGGEDVLDSEAKRLMRWAAGERRSGRLESTGRSVGGAAVTGHKGVGGIRMKGTGAGAGTFRARELGGKKGDGGAGAGSRGGGGGGSGGNGGKREKMGVERTRSVVLGNVDRKGRFA
ncbi:hypothetical protein PLEOSDRAFT_1082910 [Pleurotus ostreatus PC15]|uniref:DNA replication checkpoint mediator MRC1 domain-containing protein n=1 Tax=Pleurotus ostreatus (strain PC15) TaxID=1137138 RepID=A0A067NM71_PLEO1|nr:hypothetical protein PLEOSDRAFT_1082910 [Pleurotus ostreatus PC15]